MRPAKNGKPDLSLSKLLQPEKPRRVVPVAQEAGFDGYTICELKSGSIEGEKNGLQATNAKPTLRALLLD